MELSLKVLLSIVVFVVSVCIGAVTVGVTMSTAIAAMRDIGQGFISSLAEGVHDAVTEHFDRDESPLYRSVETFAKRYANQVPSEMMRAGKNFSAPWTALLLSQLAVHDYALVSVNVLFRDRFWITAGQSYIDTNAKSSSSVLSATTATTTTAAAPEKTAVRNVTTKFVVEWFEDLTGTGEPITVGGRRWIRTVLSSRKPTVSGGDGGNSDDGDDDGDQGENENSGNRLEYSSGSGDGGGGIAERRNTVSAGAAISPPSFVLDPTYTVPEAIQAGITLRQIDNPQFSALWGVLERQPCVFVQLIHGWWESTGNYWNSLSACRIRNVSDMTIGWTFVAGAASKELTDILGRAPRSPGGHNLLLDQSGYFVATSPGLPAFFTSRPDPTLTPATPEPPGCSNTEKTNPGVFVPPRMGCRHTPASYNFAPIRALQAKNPKFFVLPAPSGGVFDEVVDANGDAWLAAARGVYYSMMNVRMLSVTLVPYEDIYGDGIPTAIAVSASLALLLGAAAALIIWAILSRVLGSLERLQREMEAAARIGLGEEDVDHHLNSNNKNNGGDDAAELAGWATVFGEMRDDDVDIERLDDEENDRDLEGAAGDTSTNNENSSSAGVDVNQQQQQQQETGELNNKHSGGGTRTPRNPPSSAAGLALAQRLEQQKQQQRQQQRPQRQSGGSIITEIAAVELAYKTAIAALRRSAAFVPRQLLAAELLHQRRMAKLGASLAASDKDHAENAALARGTAVAIDVAPGPEQRQQNHARAPLFNTSDGAAATTAASASEAPSAVGPAAAAAASTSSLTQRVEKLTRPDATDVELACSIPPSNNNVSILLVQLEQLPEIQSLAFAASSPSSPSSTTPAAAAAVGGSNNNNNNGKLALATELLQLYFRRLTRCVMAHGGILHGFNGASTEGTCGSNSSMMASWGAPIQRQDHSVLALLCALAIRREVSRPGTRLQALFQQLFAEKQQPQQQLTVRIAVTSGSAVSGCVKDATGQIHFALLGGPVNTAGRLLAAAQRWCVSIMADEHTATPAQSMIGFRLLCLAKVKGGGRLPCFVYEPVGVNVRSAAVQAIQRGKLARDAIVAAQKRQLIKQLAQARKQRIQGSRTSISNSSSSFSSLGSSRFLSQSLEASGGIHGAAAAESSSSSPPLVTATPVAENAAAAAAKRSAEQGDVQFHRVSPRPPAPDEEPAEAESEQESYERIVKKVYAVGTLSASSSSSVATPTPSSSDEAGRSPISAAFSSSSSGGGDRDHFRPLALRLRCDPDGGAAAAAAAANQLHQPSASALHGDHHLASAGRALHNSAALNDGDDDDDGVNDGRRGDDDDGGDEEEDDDEAALIAELARQQDLEDLEQGAPSLRLSEAMSVNTLHTTDHRGLAEVLVPSVASVERLLRWHAAPGRTGFGALEHEYFRLFSAVTQDIVTRQFHSAASRFALLTGATPAAFVAATDHDSTKTTTATTTTTPSAPPAVGSGSSSNNSGGGHRFAAQLERDRGTLRHIGVTIETFRNVEQINGRNLVQLGNQVFFTDIMRGNPDATQAF